MKPELQLNEARDEVMRKIGRNVIFYQEMELMLKHIISAYSFSGYVGEIESNIKDGKKKVRKKTLGPLTGEYIGNTHTVYNMPKVEITEEKRMYFDFNVNIECDAPYFEKREQSLKAVVDDRNELIHELLMNFDLKSIEGCFKTEKYLDAKYERLLSEHDMLKRFILTAEEGLKNLSEYCKSEKFKEDWKLSALRQNRFVILLAEITEQYSRPDGWTLLNVAGEIASKETSEEMISIKKKYNFKKLKELMLATKIFDIHEESTEKGGKRVLYRLKDGWSLSSIN